MNQVRAIEAMMAEAGMSRYALSRAIGKSDSYVNSLIHRDGDVGAAGLATLAHAMGYELVLRGHGQEIAIDPNAGKEAS